MILKTNLKKFKEIDVNHSITAERLIKKILKLKTLPVAVEINNKLSSLLEIIEKDSCLNFIFDNNSETIKHIYNYSYGVLLAYALKKFDKSIKIANINAENDSFFVEFDSKESLKDLELEIISQIMSDLTLNEFTTSIESIVHDSQVKDNVYFKHYLSISNNVCYKINDFLVPKLNNIMLPSFKELKYFKITNISGAYWLDNVKNKQLQRVYGIGASTQKGLKQIISFLNEQASRDHRKIGKDLDIFMFSPIVGQGLPIWLPNGVIIKNEISKVIKELEWEHDYQEIQTPILGTLDLYKQSTHWYHYRDDMFSPIKTNTEKLILKPMQCPHHCQVYLNSIYSYRDLPIKFSEHGFMFRYEKSGALTGLERVRQMQLTDAHIFIRPDQTIETIIDVYKLIEKTLSKFNIKIDYISLSLRDPKDIEKYSNDTEMWSEAEKLLEQSLKSLNIKYTKMIGEAAFYGPKIDIQIKSALGHEITVSTVQLDLFLPKAFNLTYIDEKGNKVRPFIIHRGIIGTYERFVATLLEQTKGILPLWLSPVQCTIIPITVANDNLVEYCNKIKYELRKHHIRVIFDNSNERFNYKLRNAILKKSTYQVIIGEKELETNTVSFKKLQSKLQETLNVEQFISKISKEYELRE